MKLNYEVVAGVLICLAATLLLSAIWLTDHTWQLVLSAIVVFVVAVGFGGQSMRGK